MTEGDSSSRDTLLTTGEGAGPALDDTVPASSVTATEQARTLGRYTLVRKLGEGGMGVVWEAKDPELDRRVAIKLLREARGSKHAERLRREAQVLAQLHHPNVVSVFDVGVEDDEVYIVMQLVAGATLADVLRDNRLTSDEVLDLALQAGRGLAAAHSAGIVHRDFKPANVLVDRDGVARVSDFGLARSSEAIASASSVDVSLTRGDLVGTPAYMAPEQLRGGPVTPATDQFAFCVTLWEALAGVRPFAGRTVDELRASVLAGRPSDPPARSSRRVRAALVRGLSIDPVKRFPSMELLLAELAPRRRALWSVAAVSTIAIAAAVGVVTTRSDAVDPCARIDAAMLDGTWDANTANDVRAAFARSGHGQAADASSRVIAALDAYAARWVTTRKDACRAADRRDESQELFDRRMLCLDTRAAELRSFARSLAKVTSRQAVDASVSSALQLDSLEACNDREALLAVQPPPADAVRRSQVTWLRQQLSDTLESIQHAPTAELATRTDALLPAVRALGYQPLLAYALFVRARIAQQAGDERFEQWLIESGTVAAAAKDDHEVAHAWVQLVFGLRAMRKLDRALDVEPFARAAVSRAGSPLLDASIERAYAVVLTALGRVEEAEKRFAASLAKWPADAKVERAETLISLGILEKNRDNLVRSVEVLQEANGILEGELGPHSYALSLGLYNLSRTYMAMKRCDEAKRAGDRSLEIAISIIGADSPELALDYSSMGDLAIYCLHDLAVARSYNDRALRAVEAPSAANQRPAIVGGYGQMLVEFDQFAEATPYLERALAMSEELKDPVNTVVMQMQLARARIGTKRPADALVLLAKAIPALESMQARSEIATSRYYEGQARLALGANREAVVAFEAARTLAVEHAPVLVQKLDLALGRTLWTAGFDRARGRVLVTSVAEAKVADGDLDAVRVRDEAAAWLAAHPP